MATFAAWAQLILGIIHILFGLRGFKTPLSEAVSAGFVGQFQTPEIRRTAFWFLMCGPFTILTGHLAVHAVAINDFASLRIIGSYSLVSSLVGIAAFPKSPFWLSLVISILLTGVGFGLF